jgi:RND family efflux transporter MFP subunit
MPVEAHDLSKLRIDRDRIPAAGPRRTRWIVIGFALLLAAAAVAAVILLLRNRPVPAEVVVAEAMNGGRSVQTTQVTANGYVVARTRASVSAKVPGRLAHLGVSEGSYVRQGDVIARLENADYQAQVSQAEAQVATAQAGVIEAAAADTQARREARRLLDIQAQNPNLVSAQEVEAAVARAQQTSAQLEANRARLAAADAGLRYARAMLENTLIRAPFSGTVLRKEAEVGEVVAPSVGGSLTRGAVVTMADLTTLEVEVDVNEAYIARIAHGQPARITLDAYPDTSFRGEVRQVVPTADRQRATVQVKVRILDRDPRILPEMGARVDFLTTGEAGRQAAGPAGIRLPVAAVREQQGRSVVWLVRDGRLESREVQAGPASGGYREIRAGLVGGEVVLVAGVETPRPGLRVRIAPR